MKKLLTFLTLLTLFFGVGWAETKTATFDFSSIYSSVTTTLEVNGASISPSEGSGVTVTCYKAEAQTAPTYYNNGTALRVYSGSTIVINAGSNTITNVKFTCTANGTNTNGPSGLTVTSGTTGTYTYSGTGNYGNWVGSSTTANLSVTKNVRIKTIEVTYNEGGSTPTSYSVNLNQTTGGTISASPTTAAEGATVTLTATPNAGYEFTSWEVLDEDANEVTVTNNQFTMPASDVEVEATFTEASSGSSGRMTFVQTSSSEGTLTNAPTGVTATFSNTYTSNKEQITSGNTMTLTISGMSSRYKITGITLNVHNNKSSGEGAANVTMNGQNIGSLTITGLGNSYSEQDVNITECPFTGDLVITLSCTTNSVFCNAFYIDYEEIPAKTYDVTVTQAEGGTITASPEGEKVVDAGDKITVTATPADGYELSSWTITGANETEPDANNQITATGNVTITATFGKTQYSITNVVKTNGEVSGAGGSLNNWTGVSTVNGVWGAKFGDEISFRADTYQGYQILAENISITDASGNAVTFTFNNNVVTFTMPASNVTITANYTNYRGKLRLAGHFNGNSTWRSGDTGPEFSYDTATDKYTISAYFTGIDDGGANDYFCLTLDGEEKHPQADQGNYYIYNLNGDAMPFNLSGGPSNNFGCAPGVYNIVINGALTSMSFTKVNPTITFSPASGSEVEQGTSVSASSTLTSLIANVKDTYDSGAAGTVTVGVNTDNGNTWNASETLSTIGTATVYGKAYIGNISATGTASYTVVAANTSTTYSRITSTNDLEVGKKYIIVYESDPIALPNTVNSNAAVKLGKSITLNSDGHSTDLTGNHGVAIFKLESGNKFKYTNPATRGDYYLTLTSDNSGLRATSTSQDWTITFDNGNAQITANDGTDDRWIREFDATGGHDFRTYKTSTTNGNPVQLYKQAEPVAKDYTITYSEVTGGSATGATEANEGEQITVTVTANDGYAATGITINPSVEVTDNHDGTYTFTMPASNVTVTPSFAQAYAITYVAEPATGGLVTGVASAVYDARVEVTVTPNADYQLSGTPTYTYNGITQQLAGAGTAESPYYFNMPGYATTVTANFVKIPHGITVVSTHGDVTGIPATATSGTQVTFTVTPNAGYVVSSVSGTFNNGNSSLNITDNGDGTYTFSMPAYDVTITVTYFASEDYELLTDLSDINEEDTYLIVGGPASDLTSITHVMGNTYANTRLNAIELTENIYDNETGVITSTANMSIVNFVPGSGENEGKWAIHNAAGYLYSNSSGSLSIGSTPYYAEISLDENSPRAYMTIGSVSLTFNSNSPMFRFYSQQQGAAYIFKLANKNKVKRPTITGAAGEFLGQYNFIGKDNVSMACATDGATIEYSLDGGNTWLTYSEVFEITTNAAGNTVDVMARATKTDMEPSDVVTATFTCIKPTAPTFGTNEAGAYVNPVFVYPKSALNDRRAYGEESVSFCYTTTGTDADASSPAVTTSNSNGYYIVLDDNATLSVVTVINGIASDPAGGEYTFSVDAPAFSLAGGSYDGNQQTRLSTGTKTQQNNLSWNTVIYYTTGNTEFAFNATTGEVTSEGWVAYDPTGSPYIDILAANSTTTIKAVTLSNYFNGQTEYRASDVTTETYVLTAANLSITISPAAGTYVNAQNVTLGVKNEIGDYIIYYTTDGRDPNTNGTEYTGTPITVDHDMTIKVYAVDSRTGDGGTATAEAVYKIGIQPVVYSPFPGTIYKGNDEDINVEMFSVTPNAKIYYTVAEGEGNYPDDPTTSSTLYSEPIPLETGKVYNFRAIAVVGSLVSTVTPGKFTVQAKGSGWLNIKEMNEDEDHYYTANQLDNPVQVVYMSTHRNNGTKPEFCFVRDNSGYGLVYFGGSGVSSYNNYTKFQMGDWLAGGTVKGKLNVWDSSFINELGTSGGSITGWPSASLGNTAILPEETTNKAITDGWTYNGAYSGSDYARYIDADKNLFGHYVHMRKNTITNVTGAGGGDEKHIGIITDQSGVPLNYYDGFYLFSGYNNNKDYDQAFFNNIQSKGGTFDVYAIVYFYGPNANNSSYSNAPYEIFPIDFEWIYKPLFNIETGTYYEPQTISLTCETEGAQIWYKTSEMEAYELYTGPFEVDATTTIETYSTLPSKYNDVLESVINSITVTIGTVDAPVITEESVVKTVGESVTTDITCTSEGATIYYTTDGSDPKTSETRIEYTLGQQLTFDETTTVRAIAMQDGYYSVEAESRTYTFVKSNGIEYTLVTNVNQLNENSVYVIVNKANNMAMSTNQKTNNRGAAGVMFKNADKTIVYGNDDLAQFTLKKTGNNWYIQTNNSSENGFLSVGNGNTLLTSETANGNAEATITIDGTNTDVDKANEAHISFIYNNETTRYMRYWNRDLLFNTYTTETNAPVFLYYIEATPLATIEKEGVTTDGMNQYTIADQLQVVYMQEDMLWCKDQGNVSIAKTENPDPENIIDYMTQYGGFKGDWDQSNWVALKFTGASSAQLEELNGYVGKYIAPASVTGHYINDVNYTIEVPISSGQENILQTTEGEEYSENLYCTANFLRANHNGNATGHTPATEDKHYFFMNPKIQEICEVTFAMWNGEYFVVPEANGVQNDSRIYGAFQVDWKYNNNGNVASTLNNMPNNVFKFLALVQRPETGNGTSSLKASNPNEPMQGVSVDNYYMVYPLNLNPADENQGNIVTTINTVVAGNGEVKSIKYVNVAGIVSDRPFQGVNIVVTEYTDGSRTTSKMLHK